MNGKRITVVAVVLFLILGVGSAVFADEPGLQDGDGNHNTGNNGFNEVKNDIKVEDHVTTVTTPDLDMSNGSEINDNNDILEIPSENSVVRPSVKIPTNNQQNSNVSKPIVPSLPNSDNSVIPSNPIENPDDKNDVPDLDIPNSSSGGSTSGGSSSSGTTSRPNKTDEANKLVDDLKNIIKEDSKIDSNFIDELENVVDKLKDVISDNKLDIDDLQNLADEINNKINLGDVDIPKDSLEDIKGTIDKLDELIKNVEDETKKEVLENLKDSLNDLIHNVEQKDLIDTLTTKKEELENLRVEENVITNIEELIQLSLQDIGVQNIFDIMDKKEELIKTIENMLQNEIDEETKVLIEDMISFLKNEETPEINATDSNGNFVLDYGYVDSSNINLAVNDNNLKSVYVTFTKSSGEYIEKEYKDTNIDLSEEGYYKIMVMDYNLNISFFTLTIDRSNPVVKLENAKVKNGSVEVLLLVDEETTITSDKSWTKMGLYRYYIKANINSNDDQLIDSVSIVDYLGHKSTYNINLINNSIVLDEI